MTEVNRRARRGRRLALVGAIVLLVACLLPWYTFAGALPADPRHAWDGSGILALVAGLATLALLARNPARGVPRPPADPWIAYPLLAAVAVLAVAIWPFAFVDAPRGLLPDRAPGYLAGIVGAALLAAAAIGTPRRGSPPLTRDTANR